MEEFRRTLNRFRSEKGQGFTHTSIGSPKVSLFVPDEQLDAFMAAYKRALTSQVPLHMTEKPSNVRTALPSAFRVDLDFKFALPEPNQPRQRMYLAEDVARIVVSYFRILSAYMDAPDEAFVAYVLEKPAPSEFKGQLKDGLHLVWPHLVCGTTLMHMVRKQIIDRASEVFAGLPVINTFDVIIDSAIIDRNNWQMYGSCKPEQPAYRVTRVLTYDRAADAVTDVTPAGGVPAEEELRFVDLFSMRNKREHTPLLQGKAEEVEEYARHVLPTLDERRKNKLHQQIFSKSLNHLRNYCSDDDLALARLLVTECISQHRAESYEDWIKLGWALRNVDCRLLDTWVDFSKFSSKYVGGECEKLWNTMRRDTMGIGSLRWWAKQDNELEYNRVLESSVMVLIDRCTTDKAHYDVARVVQAMLKDDYRFTGMDTWYVFNRTLHRWVRTREGHKLRLELSTRVCGEFMRRSTYHSQQANIVADDQKEQVLKKSVQMHHIATCLKQNGYKESIIRECKALFTDDAFEALLDSHEHLLGFDNGVYDLRMHEFRDGSPDDYISFTTGRHYMPFDPTSVEALEIALYLSQVFTNANVLAYFKNLLLVLIDGGIRQEKFYVFTGSGSNSKSALLNLVQKALGEYYCILPIALLTQKRAASNAAQSELARTKGRRVAVMQEPGDNETINIGLMKELSGGDRVQCRALFKEPIEFRPQFKMIMTCNELPDVPGNDGGTWRRIRVIEFTSKFCEAPNPDNPREFPIDGSLLEKFERWADTFISMLIHHHKSTDTPNNNNEPLEVRIATESYKANNDVVGQFVNERLERVADPKQTLSFKTAFDEFRTWAFNAIGKGKRLPDRIQLKTYMEKTFGLYPKGGWKGLRYVAPDEEDAEAAADDEEAPAEA